MKIMSFNTQHCLSYIEQKIDYELMADAILSCEADAVGLNEIYTAQTEKLSELTGMKYCYFAPAIEVPGRGLYGNGFLSKIPIIKASKIMIPDPEQRAYKGYYETRCIIKAELEGGVTVLVSHFGLNPDEQANAVKAVIESLADEKCIFMGDLNMVPENPLLDPIKSRMKDTAALFDEPGQSYPSTAPDRKIDYIFVSHDVSVISADIPPIVASDHRPHVAEIVF